MHQLQINETLLRIKVFVAPILQARFDLIRREVRGAVRRRQSERLQAARVHRVDDDRRTIGEVCQVLQRIEDAVAALRRVGESVGLARAARRGFVTRPVIENLKAIRDQDDGLAPRQFPQAAHDEVERAERANREEVFAEGV